MANETGTNEGKRDKKSAKNRKRTKEAAARKKQFLGKCSWRRVDGQPCKINTYYIDPTTGETYCRKHYQGYFLKGQKSELEDHRANAVVDDAIRVKKGPNALKKLETMTEGNSETAIDTALRVQEAIESGDYEEPIKAAADPQTLRNAAIQRFSKRSSLANSKGLMSIDIDYYTPDFKDDYFYLLNHMLRRKHAVCNLLLEQLLRIEDEEEVIKLVETYGEQILDGERVQFSNVTKRHATPVELKLKLLETLNKHEREYRELLKQRADTLINALLILKKFNIRFDKKAGMLMVDLIQKCDHEGLDPQLAVDTDFKRVDEDPPIPEQDPFLEAVGVQQAIEEEEDW